MCIRIEFAPHESIQDPWDRARNTIVISRDLSATVVFTTLAVRAVLTELGTEQPDFGARCWCGEDVELLAAIPKQRQNEVIHLGA
ncbi:hypothetical protein [Streptomyces rochei]|uniref:hypothetical protein n=1 Tax=Streptomyces rochei TaxID=1928 RepID=UPI003640CF81